MVFLNIRISAYNQAIIVRFGRLGENAYLCIRKGEECSWLNYSPIKSIPQ
ncbi:hypothetical protein GCWU000325_00728 [Alloprevotella tannerae ATCC 51259]|uniref:Uncharacterized protein n=1 Tax=Alloprevotella tannerae ATCC 51259 TaxID=626522 RepID=C9LEU7_9BACT|nr:hypothetical protein GCWU000325_00728 [Alloprevotella tannerae ATCC 51259]